MTRADPYTALLQLILVNVGVLRLHVDRGAEGVAMTESGRQRQLRLHLELWQPREVMT